MSEERRAPVQADPQGRHCPRDMPPGTIAWSEHLEAAKAYNRHHLQDAETLAQRGGFGYAELIEWLGHEPVTWQPRADQHSRVDRAFLAGAEWARTRAQS